MGTPRLGKRIELSLPRPEIDPVRLTTALRNGWVAAEIFFSNERTLRYGLSRIEKGVKEIIQDTDLPTTTWMCRNGIIRMVSSEKIKTHTNERVRSRGAISFGARAQRDLTLSLLKMPFPARNAVNQFLRNEEYWSANYAGAITVARLIQEMLVRDIPVYFPPPPEMDESFSIDLIAGPWPNGKMLAIQVKPGGTGEYWIVRTPPTKEDDLVFHNVWAGVNAVNRRQGLNLVPAVIKASVGKNRANLMHFDTQKVIHDITIRSIPSPRLSRAS